MVEAAGDEEQQLAAEMAAAFLNENLPDDTFGSPKAGPGMWASVLRIISPINGRTIQKLALEQNEAAFSMALVKFASRGDEQFLLVGTVKDLVLNPRSSSGGFIHVYQLTDAGEKLDFLHKTPVEDVPGAIASFQVGMLPHLLLTITSTISAGLLVLALNGYM